MATRKLAQCRCRSANEIEKGFSSLGRNAQYSSEQVVAELLQCLSLVIEEQVLCDLQSNNFYSLMTDESTDIAVVKQLVLVGDLTNDGIKTSFLCITDIPNGTAETIEGAILKVLSEKDLHISRLCAFGSDGASVMTGRLSGVAVRLTRHSPRMIAVHCVNHYATCIFSGPSLESHLAVYSHPTSHLGHFLQLVCVRAYNTALHPYV